MKSFVSDLMPYYPIYLDLLPLKVQNVIGNVHLNTLPARNILEQEGFNWKQSIDIFDAGPILESNINDIHTIRNSKVFNIMKENDILPISDMGFTLISNEDFNNFRALLLKYDHNNQFIKLNSAQFRALNIKVGNTMRLVNLYPRNK